MKRLTFLTILLLAIFLLVTSCFKPPFVVVTLNSDAVSKNVAAGTTITFDWSFQTADSFKEVVYKLHINDEIVDLQATEYATSLTVGEYEVWVEALGKLSNESSFRNFQSNRLEFTVGSASVVFENTETAYATKTVTVSWQPADGLDHTYLYSVDGAEFTDTDATSVTLTNLAEGTHTVQVKTEEFNGPPNRFVFKVDTVGPTVNIYGSDRYNGTLADGDFMPFGRYIFASWSFSEPVSKVEIRFRETTEEGHPYLTDWLNWDLTVPSILLNDENVSLYLADGFDVMPYMFELGHTYLLYVRGYDKLGNSNYKYVSFKLEERYSGQDKPEIFFVPVFAEPASEEAPGSLVIAIGAPNVKEYIEKEKEYFAPDNTKNGDLMYLQTSLIYQEQLTLENVMFPDFLPDKKNVSNFVDFGDEVVLIRGFVDEPTQIEAVSDAIAFVEFSFGPEMNGAKIMMALNFDYYIRDDANRTIDGIVVDNFFWNFDLPDPVAAEM